jgi:hypothetical protein
MWHIVMKNVIQIELRRPEQEEPLGRPERKMKSQCLKEMGWEDRIVFVRLMIRISGRFFCTL